MAYTLQAVNSEGFTSTDAERFFDISKSARLLSKIDSGAISLPTGLQQLDSGEDVNSFVYTVDEAASLGFAFGSGDAKYSRKICIQNYVKFKDLTDGDQRVRYGVGIRWIANVKTISAQAKLNSIASISASAQMGYAEAIFSFSVIGLQSAEITKTLPGVVSELNPDTYAIYHRAFSRVKELIWENNIAVTPQLVSIVGSPKNKPDEEYQDALAVGWALSKISDNWTLEDAQEGYKHASDRFKSVVKSVYVSLVNEELDAKPDALARAQAEKLLGGLEVDD
jgi:hypothetical protein